MLFSGDFPVWANMAVLPLAFLVDIAFGEPKIHLVPAIGKLINLAEKAAPKEGRLAQFLYGLAMAIVLPLALAGLVYVLMKNFVTQSQVFTILYILLATYTLKCCFAVRELSVAGLRVARSLEDNNLQAAREDLKSLVSRDTAGLSDRQAASAAVESVAENTTDGFLAPWLAFAFFGLPGAIAYRTVNTMDSMIGYHGRYEYLGKAAARLDDMLNFVPARLAGTLTWLAAFLTMSHPGRAGRSMWQQHGRTESPNAGWTMSAMAGALGVELEKVGHYRLGTSSHEVGPGDIVKATRLMWLVAVLGLLSSLLMMLAIYAFKS